MKCKNCGQEKDTYNDRNPWNDCKQFISQENKSCEKMAFCYKCNKFVSCPSCLSLSFTAFLRGTDEIRDSQNHSKGIITLGDGVIPSLPNHSPQVSSTLEKDKDPHSLQVKDVGSLGSDIKLSDKIFYPNGHKGEFK